MAASFGFSVGDFITLGKLIAQVAVEIGENGQAAPEFQSLLMELEALERALAKLKTIRPAKHELFQLTSIRATASACERPLKEFLTKISRFESRLGTFNAASNKWRGLPRRMQFRMMFREDVKTLRTTLASHVATINLLLMTQAVTSIALAEDDRHNLASSLETRILEHRRLLESTDNCVHAIQNNQETIHDQLVDQRSFIHELGRKTDSIHQQLADQKLDIEEGIHSLTMRTREHSSSILSKMTDILSLTASGLLRLQQIGQQIQATIQLCTSFTEEMRIAMSDLMKLFCNIQASLHRINQILPTRLCAPTIHLTTALGETMALPLQLCQQWMTFSELLKVVFLDKPGKTRVDMGKYLVMTARGGRLLKQDSWQHAIKQDDHLSMSFVLDEISVKDGICPFPSCHASTMDARIENGGRTCPVCGRWSLIAAWKLDLLQRASATSDISAKDRQERTEYDNKHLSVHECSRGKEDIELYRQVHVQLASEEYATPEFIPADNDSLTENDALSYIDKIKARFAESPDKYNNFLDVMRDFQNGSVDTRGVIACIVKLFRGEDDLIQDFERFCPRGYILRYNAEGQHWELEMVSQPKT